MRTNKNGVPNEVLHYTERDEYRNRLKSARVENFIFALVCVVILALTFYMGRFVERHFAYEPQKSSIVVKEVQNAKRY